MYTRRRFSKTLIAAAGGAASVMLVGSCSNSGYDEDKTKGDNELDFTALLDQYRSELLDRVVPFWVNNGVDLKNGGLNTSLSYDGKVLSENKYMWSQLRAIWIFSALYNKVEQRQEWLDVAEHIYKFVKEHGRDEQGRWKFSVDKDGNTLKGSSSIYSDAFAIEAFTELAKAGNKESIQLAVETYHSVQARLSKPGSYSTVPIPIPAGAKAHGISLIFGKIFYDLGQYLKDPEIINAALEHTEQVMTVFRRPEHQCIYEFVNLDNTLLETPPGQTVVPGHAIESMWFMIHIYQQEKNQERINQAIECIHWHIKLGWDPEYGGIVMARNAKGSFWENKWDTKVWWPHTEALYGLLLAYSISEEPWCLEWYKKVHDYSYSHFSVPGNAEWLQRLDRYGKEISNLDVMPQIDPYHLTRSLIYCIDVLEKLVSKSKSK